MIRNSFYLRGKLYIILDQPWRTGSKVGRTIYIAPPGEDNHPEFLIGMLDTPELAEHVVRIHNLWLEEGE